MNGHFGGWRFKTLRRFEKWKAETMRKWNKTCSPLINIKMFIVFSKKILRFYLFYKQWFIVWGPMAEWSEAWIRRWDTRSMDLPWRMDERLKRTVWCAAERHIHSQIRGHLGGWFTRWIRFGNLCGWRWEHSTRFTIYKYISFCLVVQRIYYIFVITKQIK